MNNGVGINYASDRFSDTYDPMHYAYVQVSRRTAYGSVFARLNYSTRFGTRGSQVEVDLYPRIAAGVYAYLNYGTSASDLFPRHRAGGELYTKLPSSYEGSLGLRYLFFGPSSSLTIYTASLGYYFGSYWISFRPYFIPNDAGLSKSASLTMRRYLTDPENFISLRAGAGFSADERTIQSSTGFEGTEVFYLQSQTVGLGWQGSLATNYLLVTTLDVTNQELGFHPGTYVVMYSLSVGVRVRF
jgi:YaiO family outer membrane protein